MSFIVLKICRIVAFLAMLINLLEYEKTFLLQEDATYTSPIEVYKESILYLISTDIVQVSIETGKIERTFRGHTAEVNSFVVLNNTLMVSLSEYEYLVVWDLETGSILKRYKTDIKNFRNDEAALIDNLLLLGDFNGAITKIDLDTDKVSIIARPANSRRCVLQHREYALICINGPPGLSKINPRTGASVRNLVRPGTLYTAVIFDDFIFTSGTDGRVVQWDIETGRLIKSFNNEEEPSYSLHFYDGFLYSVNNDRTIARWNIATGERSYLEELKLRISTLPMVFFRDVAFYGANNGLIFSHNLTSGKPRSDLKVAKRRLVSVVIWKELVLSAGYASRIYAWKKDLYDFDPVLTLDTQTSDILCLSVYNDSLFSSGKSSNVHQWSLPDLTILKVFEGPSSNINSIVARNGFFYSAGDDNKILQWNIITASILFQFEGHSGSVNQLKLYNALLFSAGNDRTARAWNVNSQEALNVFNFVVNVLGALLLDDKAVFSLTEGIAMYQMSSLQILVELPELVSCKELITDGSVIYSSCDDTRIKVRDPNSLEITHELKGHSGVVTSLCFDESGILFSTGYDGTINRWNVTDRSVDFSFKDFRRRVTSMVVDSGDLYVGLHTGAIELYDTRNALLQGQSQIHLAEMSSLIVSDDKVYSSGLDGRILEYSMKDLSQYRILYQNTSTSINSLVFSASHLTFISGLYEIQAFGWNENKNAIPVVTSVDPLVCLAATESTIFVGSKFGTINAWSISNGTLLFEMTAHSSPVNDLLAVGSLLYSASDDGSIVEWSVISGESLRVFERQPLINLGHVGPVLSLAICNGALFTGGSDATTRRWNLTSANNEDVFFGPSKAVAAVRCDNFTLFSGSYDLAVYMYRFDIHQIPTTRISFTSTSKTRQETRNVPIISNESTSGETSPILYIVLALSVLLLLAAMFFFRTKIKTRKSVRANIGEDESTKDTSSTNTDLRTFVNTSIGISKHAAFELPSESVAASKKLTAGGGGEVFLAKLMNPVLAKKHGEIVIQKQVFVKNQLQEEGFFQEVGILVMLSTFPHFCQIIGYTLNPFAMILKFYPEGSLSDWVTSKSLTLTHVIKMSFEIAQGLNTMHSHFLAHCDIKPQNILIEANDLKPSCYITDFGITQVLSQKALASNMFNVINVRGVSVHYAAPDAIKWFRTKDYSRVDFKTFDVFSFGMLIYFILSRRAPWA